MNMSGKTTLTVSILLAVLLIGSATATPFSAWSNAGGCWTATNGTYNLTMWNKTGDFSYTIPAGATTATMLGVAGGGSGGGLQGGGGGAGGVREDSIPLTPGSVVFGHVGLGGNQVTGTAQGNNGDNSSFAGFEAKYGGGGASVDFAGQAGGSGGGGSRGNAGGSALSGQGNDGNVAPGSGAPAYGANGGGGGDQQGQLGSSSAGGNGGRGRISSITGEAIYYGNGGGGGVNDNSLPGIGGLGTGGIGGNSSIEALPGADGFGDGGGGAGQIGSYVGAKGGNGTVIISYAVVSTPVANFTLNATSGFIPVAVSITDTSTGVPSTFNYTAFNTVNNTEFILSSLQNPVVVFNNGGNYSIMLNASNGAGFNKTALYAPNHWVNVSSPILASFTTNVSRGAAPLAVAFTDTSTNVSTIIDTYSWIFGDIGGTNTSTVRNPTHVYTTPGTYTANLTITNTSMSLTSTALASILVNATVAADFVGAPTSGFTPQLVTFADLSTGSGIYAWNWSFGDGSFSILQNPSHNYVTSGAFDVSLNVTGLDGFNKKTVSPYINIASGSSFIGEPRNLSTYALDSRFTDLYPTGHLTWNWSFGDTYFNTTQNPRHYYSVAGKYNVSLNTTTSAFGVNITSQANYVNISSDLPNVVSWMHMDGNVGATNFTDQMGNAWLPTFVTKQSAAKFGPTSALFNNPGSTLTTPTSTAFNFGTGNFTIEQWVNLSSSGSNRFIVSRTTSASARSDGWGLYHSTASAASDGWVFWLGNAATGSTGTFTIPLNQWNHIAIQRIQPQGDVIVSVNGVAVTATTGLSGNYDTSNGVAYGNPIAGAGVFSAQMGLDETRISNVARWTTSSSAAMLFSTPPTAYVGDLYPLFPDPNPNATLRFKTNPGGVPSAAYISNGTPRQRTTQIQFVNMTNNISVTEIFPAQHIFISGVTANSTTYSGINFTYVNIDNVNGLLSVNLTRPGGFTTTGLTESRASIFDASTTYYNYSSPNTAGDIQYFGNGFMGNLTTGVFYPVTRFIPTNVTYLDWVTYSNFTISKNNPIAMEDTVTFIPKNNWSANQFDWNFGDGTVINNVSTGLQTHLYTTPGNYTVSLRSYLSQNGSVTNSTTLFGAINVVYNASFVQADFVGVPTSGSPGLNVAFTDLSIFGTPNATSGRTYNWSFGDTGFTLQPYSNTIGNVNHVYTNLGTFTVMLTVNNTLNSSTVVKTNYITISTSQNANTWYTQRLVRLKALTAQGVPIMGANISAVFLSSSLPNTSISWIQSAFGVTASVAQQMLDGTLLMSDISGGDGSTTFMMFPGIRYGVSIQNATSGLNFHTTILPNDNDYMIYCPDVPTFSQNVTQRQFANTSLFITEPNNSYVTFNILYQDTSGLTTNVRWNVTQWDNMTPMYYRDFGNPFTSLVSDNYTVPNIRGQQWKFWYNATRSAIA